MNYSFTPGTPGVYDIGALQSFVDSLPNEEEQIHAMVILLNIKNLSSYVNDYGSSVGLHSYVQHLREGVFRDVQPGTLDFTNQMHMLKNWSEMAGREAAMTVYHVGKALMQIKNNLRFTEIIKMDTNSEILKKASKALEHAFPNYEIARNSVAHRAEAMATFEHLKAHATETEDGQNFLIGKIEGDSYVATFKKSYLTCHSQKKLGSG